jgi:hypothetical protein
VSSGGQLKQRGQKKMQQNEDQEFLQDEKPMRFDNYDPSKDCKACPILSKNIGVLTVAVQKLEKTAQKNTEALNGFVDKRGALGRIENLEHAVDILNREVADIRGQQAPLFSRLTDVLLRVETKLDHEKTL